MAVKSGAQCSCQGSYRNVAYFDFAHLINSVLYLFKINLRQQTTTKMWFYIIGTREYLINSS